MTSKLYLLLVTIFIINNVSAKISDQDVLSYALVDLETELAIDEKNTQRPMILASVSKMLTYYFALKVLGPQDQFKTEVYYTGNINKQGVLRGDVYLKGDGDPHLTANNLLSLVFQMKNHGVKKVIGSFYYDKSEIFSFPRISTVGLEDQTDNAGGGALNLDFNRYNVWTHELKTHPPLSYLDITSTKKGANGLRFSRDKDILEKELWRMHALEKLDEVEDLPVVNSVKYTGNFFQYLAKRHGIDLLFPKKKSVPKNAKKIAIHKGMILSKLSSLGIEYSNNLIAEMVLLRAAKYLKQEKLSLKESSEAMRLWFKKMFPNLNWSGVTLDNGSGLTIHNKASSKTIAKLLSLIDKDKDFEGGFLSYLSINGHGGGVLKRLKHPDYAYRVYAKTGSLYYVSNLSGYLVANSGKRYAFSVFTSNPKNRGILNKNNSPLLNKLRTESSKWKFDSNEIIDNQLKKWITER